VGAHAGLAAQAAQHGGVDGRDGAVHVGVVHRGHAVALRARDQVLLNGADRAEVCHVAVEPRLQRHVLCAHLPNKMVDLSTQ
jgi:hypothetical protein